MTGPLTFSALFHISVFILAVVGLPHIKPDLPMMQNPISVEIVDIDDITRTDKNPASSSHKRKTTKQEQKPKKDPPPRLQAPKVTAKTPPKPVAPVRPDPADIVALPRDKKTPAPAKAPPKPRKRPTLTSHEKPPEEDFKSLLRNLADSEPVSSSSSDAPDIAEKPSLLASFSQRLTMSEQDALRQQLSSCWNLMAGARFAEDLVVAIKLFMNPDRTIREARIVDQFRYNRDSFFRAAGDSALRAVMNPRCNPLNLPPQKYEQWKEITIHFDPREML